MWMIGKSPAQATAKRVIASANRLIDMRHCCRRSSRIAEIRVPAWPMPIHQTKLMMAKAQPIGMLTPQIPTPRARSHAIEMRSSWSSPNASAKPANHPMGVFFWRTRLAILSVTVAKVWPGPTIRDSG
jgi:hypothetical protein